MLLVDDLLSRVELFRPLETEALRALAARGTRRRFAEGAVLMRQGDPSPSLYVILSGRVRVDRTTASSPVHMLAEIDRKSVV